MLEYIPNLIREVSVMVEGCSQNSSVLSDFFPNDLSLLMN